MLANIFEQVQNEQTLLANIFSSRQHVVGYAQTVQHCWPTMLVQFAPALTVFVLNYHFIVDEKAFHYLGPI